MVSSGAFCCRPFVARGKCASLGPLSFQDQSRSVARREVRVSHRCGNGTVLEQFLDGAKIYATPLDPLCSAEMTEVVD